MKLTKILFAVGLLFSFFSFGVNAQCTLTGAVKDALTGQPLAGATINLDLKKTGIATDNNGVFTLQVTCNEHIINVRFVGYENYSKRFSLFGDLTMDIMMEPAVDQLPEVVVSGQSTNRTLESPSLGVNYLNLRSIAKLPVAAGEVDLLRAVQILPGVTSVGEGSNGINIRGGNTDQNWIYIDNMPVFNPTHMLGLFSVLPADAMREIQLYKGSIPARFGGRTASVMDIKMIEPSTQEFKAKGGIGLISNRLNLEIPIVEDKLSVLLSARLSYNEYLINFYNSALVDARIAEKPIPNNRANFYDLANKIVYKPNLKNTITFSNYLSNDKYEADGLFSIAQGLGDHTIFKYGHHNYALRWNYNFNDSLNFSLTGVSSNYFNITSVPKGAAPLDLTTKVHYIGLRPEVTYLYNKHKIIAGANIVRYGVSPAKLEPREGSVISSLELPHEQAYESALYVADEYELSARWLIELGLRGVFYVNAGPYEQAIYLEGQPKSVETISGYESVKSGGIEKAYFKAEPRLAFRYKVNKYSSIKAGYNRMNQFLHMISNNTTPLPNARWKTANRYIPPQQSDLVTLGYFREKEDGKWEYSIEGYYKWQRHIFDYITASDLQITPDIETQILSGKGKSYGLELLFTKKYGKTTGWVGYTYARALQRITGDVPALQQLNNGDWFPTNTDKPHTFNALVNFIMNEHISASFTFTYSTGRPFTAPVGAYKTDDFYLPIYAERNNTRISDYHRLDFSLSVNPPPKKKNWSTHWVFTIYNLYGRKNAYSYFYVKDKVGLKPYKLSVFTSPLVSLTYNFKFK